MTACSNFNDLRSVLVIEDADLFPSFKDMTDNNNVIWMLSSKSHINVNSLANMYTTLWNYHIKLIQIC